MAWLDVQPGDWFFKDVTEASNIQDEDGGFLIASIPYNAFEGGSPYLYTEITSQGQSVFTLDVSIVPTSDNPLFVYIDGVQTVYKSVEQEGGQTKVTLYSPARQGAVGSFISLGTPSVDRFGKPYGDTSGASYPSYTLSKAVNYKYDKFSRNLHEQVTAFGKLLRRIDISDADWAGNVQNLLEAKIKYNTDVYTISPQGVMYVPYNLNNVTCSITYSTTDSYAQTTETFKPTSAKVLFLNRFFPNAQINRAEAFILVNKLMKIMYQRFTDVTPPSRVIDETFTAYEGQVAFLTNGKYPSGKNELKVWKNGTLLTYSADYTETSDYSVTLNSPLSSVDTIRYFYERSKSDTLVDVGEDTKYYNTATSSYIDVIGTASGSWWASHILDLENEVLSDGSKMVSGTPVTSTSTHEGQKVVHVDNDYNPISGSGDTETWFLPYTHITRAEGASILNRFRKLCMDRFL
ncbi:hypothetical protein SAMN05446037_100675 [Anaerovirgula multivorans]|uniref:Uncharacterized protein n=1 Tax=Anaerovirgula multivorans TaxID=312168 RepID=A0A239CQA7_9FIRM|nr:hypothetical protein [Anaerovirgula multivorans]SNS21851.1 hypothetical protein SAMN05446037_100675 [Anaerovirgula multivorans]